MYFTEGALRLHVYGVYYTGCQYEKLCERCFHYSVASSMFWGSSILFGQAQWNVKCTLKFKGRPEALRFALLCPSSLKSSVDSFLLYFSLPARCTEEFALEGWTWVWNILRIKEPPTSPTITQTALRASVSRRSRRRSSWTSSKGQLKTEQERNQK